MDTLILSEVTSDGELPYLILYTAARWGKPHCFPRSYGQPVAPTCRLPNISTTRFQGEGCAAGASFPLETGRLKWRKLRWSEEGLSLFPSREEGEEGARFGSLSGGAICVLLWSTSEIGLRALILSQAL